MPISGLFSWLPASENLSQSLLKEHILFLLCGVITSTSVAIVDHNLMDLSVAEKSSNFKGKYVVENCIHSSTLVCTRILGYSGTSLFSGIDQKQYKL